MAMLEPIAPNDLEFEERRRFQRVRVNLLGRYMLLDKREFPCQVIEMSPGDMVMIAPQVAREGERIIAYIDHLGRWKAPPFAPSRMDLPSRSHRPRESATSLPLSSPGSQTAIC